MNLVKVLLAISAVYIVFIVIPDLLLFYLKKSAGEMNPPKDLVEVVRCKKCRYYNPDGEYCGMWGECRHPEHYCEEGDPACGE